MWDCWNCRGRKIWSLTAISGCSPSYVISFFKGMTDYAIANSFEKEQTFKIIVQAIIGSVINTEKTKAEITVLINQICLLNGSTIEREKC